MKAERIDPNGSRLRDLLRRGDPAADDPGMPMEEIARLRRTIVTTGGRRAALRGPAAWAAVAAALLLLVLAVDRGGFPTHTPRPPGGPVPGSIPVPPPAPVATADPGGAPAPSVAAKPIPAGEARRPARPQPPAEPAAPAMAPGGDVTTARNMRQVQFTAPGGTRILWTLDPDFQL